MYNVGRCRCGRKLGKYEMLKCQWCYDKDENRQRIDENKLYNTHCPKCGSFDYVESVRVEVCNSCGYEQGY